MKRYSIYLTAACMLLASGSLFAQGGCVDSPENPTAVLALAGMAGAGAVSLLSRFRRRR